MWGECAELGSADGNLCGFIFPKGSLVLKRAHFWPKHFTFRNVSRKKIMIVYKMHHQDCSSQQEAVGCINDAISIQVNPVQSVKRMRRQCFPNWPFPIARGSLSCYSSCLWSGGKSRWDWEFPIPISTSPPPLLSVLHIRFIEKVLQRMHSRAKRVCIMLL